MKKCALIGENRALPIYYRGPGLELKNLPALIYLALSGEASLTLDPFCQPVDYLEGAQIHVFSFTLPGHGEGWDNKMAIHYWVNAILEGENIIEQFVRQSVQNIDYLIEHYQLDRNRIAVSGLSRGAFAATHIAATHPDVNFVLGYAPLTRLDVAEEFEKYASHQIIQDLSLINLAEKLVKKQVRYYIGNRDVRVGTEACFKTIQAFTEAAYLKGERSPKIELLISPSVGYKGHGTLPPTFKSGVDWLKDLFKK